MPPDTLAGWARTLHVPVEGAELKQGGATGRKGLSPGTKHAAISLGEAFRRRACG
jgi:hypothetical protein